MRTVAQLADLTGIDYETVRYYCTPERPVNPEKGARGRRGAGLIRPSAKMGRWNLYDDEALFDLAVAGLMGKSGMSVDDMRRALNGDADFSALAQEQEKRLRKKLRMVDRELRTAGVLRRFFEALEAKDDEALARSIQDCGMLAVESLGDRIEEDERLGPLKGLRPSEVTKEEGKRIESLLRRRRSIERKGGERDELEMVDKEIASLSTVQREGDSIGGLVTRLGELREAGRPCDDPEVLECVKEVHRSFRGVFENLTEELLEPLIRANVTGNYLAMMLEIGFGEGFVTYILDATKSYCVRSKHREKDISNG